MLSINIQNSIEVYLNNQQVNSKEIRTALINHRLPVTLLNHIKTYISTMDHIEFWAVLKQLPLNSNDFLAKQINVTKIEEQITQLTNKTEINEKEIASLRNQANEFYNKYIQGSPSDAKLPNFATYAAERKFMLDKAISIVGSSSLRSEVIQRVYSLYKIYGKTRVVGIYEQHIKYTKPAIGYAPKKTYDQIFWADQYAQIEAKIKKLKHENKSLIDKRTKLYQLITDVTNYIELKALAHFQSILRTHTRFGGEVEDIFTQFDIDKMKQSNLRTQQQLQLSAIRNRISAIQNSVNFFSGVDKTSRLETLYQRLNKIEINHLTTEQNFLVTITEWKSEKVQGQTNSQAMGSHRGFFSYLLSFFTNQSTKSDTFLDEVSQLTLRH